MNAISARMKKADPSGFPVTSVWDGRERLPLAEGWSLTADSNQWILCRARKRRSGIKWQPIKFIGSNSRVLRRLLREMGIEPTPEAEAALNAFPAEFREWCATTCRGRRG